MSVVMLVHNTLPALSHRNATHPEQLIVEALVPGRTGRCRCWNKSD